MEITSGEWTHSVLNGTKTPATLFVDQNGIELDIAVFEKWDQEDWAKREMQANADLLTEAGNVANETGLTPRQILKQRDDLREACQNMRGILATISESRALTLKEYELFCRAEKTIAASGDEYWD